MAPFDRPYTTFCWSTIVNIALFCTVFDYLTLNNIVILKSGLEVTQDHSTGTIRKLGYGFLLAFHSNYGSILHHFRDAYWSKIVIFVMPPCIRHPVRGFPSEYCHPIWCGKTRMVGLLDGKKTLRIYVLPFRQNTGVWQTDGRTDILPRHSPRYAYASRGKNVLRSSFCKIRMTWSESARHRPWRWLQKHITLFGKPLHRCCIYLI